MNGRIVFLFNAREAKNGLTQGRHKIENDGKVT